MNIDASRYFGWFANVVLIIAISLLTPIINTFFTEKFGYVLMAQISIISFVSFLIIAYVIFSGSWRKLNAGEKLSMGEIFRLIGTVLIFLLMWAQYEASW